MDWRHHTGVGRDVALEEVHELACLDIDEAHGAAVAGGGVTAFACGGGGLGRGQAAVVERATCDERSLSVSITDKTSATRAPG